MKIRLYLMQSIVFSISGRRNEPFYCTYSQIVLLISYTVIHRHKHKNAHWDLLGVMRTHCKQSKAKWWWSTSLLWYRNVTAMAQSRTKKSICIWHSFSVGGLRWKCQCGGLRPKIPPRGHTVSWWYRDNQTAELGFCKGWRQSTCRGQVAEKDSLPPIISQPPNLSHFPPWF